MLALLLGGSALLLPASSRYTRPALPPLLARAAAADSNAALLPPPDDLSDEAMLSIVLSETSDQQTNELVWKYLGYTRGADGEWDASAVFPNWRKKYPTPPDLIGVTRTYSREVDEPVLPPSPPSPPPAALLPLRSSSCQVDEPAVPISSHR